MSATGQQACLPPTPLAHFADGRVLAHAFEGDERHLLVQNRCSGYYECAEMSESKVSGVVHLIEETKTYGSKGFRKRLVVLEQENGSFTNYIPIEFIRDTCDAVDDMNLGDEIEVVYRLSGRRWQRDEASEVKFFLSAEGMSFKVVGSAGGTMTERVSEPNDAFAEAGDDEAPF